MIIGHLALTHIIKSKAEQATTTIKNYRMNKLVFI